jgi:1-acyl-sn-glycerol-3-phosphate acyltransferase
MLIIRVVHTISFYLICLISFFIGILLSFFCALFAKNKTKVFQNAATVWSRFILFFSGCRVECSGLENIPRGKGLILVSNHQGNADIPILLANLPVYFHFIIKKELFSIPLFSWYLRKAEYLSVDRKSAASAFTTLKQALTVLKKGEAIMIFPEGTRSRDGKLGPFKRGGMMLAFQSKAPVVPIAIDGSFQAQKRGSLLFYPQKIKLMVGKPIEFPKAKEMNREEQEIELEKIRQAIQTLLSAK